MLAEILSNVARSQRRDLVVDGSLTDCAWFKAVQKFVFCFAIYLVEEEELELTFAFDR